MADEEDEQKTDALGRKVWDKDAAVERAKSNIMFGPERIGRRKDPVIPLPSSQRTYLKGRTVDLELDKTLGQSKVVTAHTIKPLQGGYWCSVCECLIKDSASYLEHVNGRRHNRNLGMNMKVEKIGIERVREKLNGMRKESEVPTEPEDIVARLQKIEEEQEEKKRRKKEKKRKKKGGGDADEEKGGDDAEDDEEPVPKKTKAVAEGDEDGDDADEPGEGEDTEEIKMLKAMGLPTGFG
eukprot:TRINITY_DN5045_c0_g2_i2.p1 TRINITY_DN5045_c0_g2~~TRINITY_DN5045_c0_g2_i2.p1  ORF type:complete len:239 (+),score=67.96 TRINITY_DN5045_c0_g2_i2:81-797(+)